MNREKKNASQESSSDNKNIKTFKEHWLNNPEYSLWINSVEKKPEKAYCHFCKKELSSNTSVLNYHLGTFKHQRNFILIINTYSNTLTYN